MKILAIAEFIPMPDRQAGMLRFFHLLRMLASRHRITFCAHDGHHQPEIYGSAEIDAYKAKLASLGVDIAAEQRGEINRVLRRDKFDVVLFEHYRYAVYYLDEARFWQPQARIVVDTIDVAFKRLLSKAESTGHKPDLVEALATKRIELPIYASADAVIAVSHSDETVLKGENKRVNVEIIPLLHSIPELAERSNGKTSGLIFVGNFEHSANADAMVYFCRDILPAIKRRIPDARLSIIGNRSLETVGHLANAHIDVRGFVPALRPLYEASDISVAPMTWGGGLKGKITEAMSYGLPVVTTTVGIEGFGLSPGQNVLVADTPEAFAEAVISLYESKELYENVRREGWGFVNRNYSENIHTDRVLGIFDKIGDLPVKRLPLTKALRRRARRFIDRNISWRFRHA